MKVLVTSPMRTGSTWVHAVLITLLRAERHDFVSTPAEALAIAKKCRSCVAKSHSIIDVDLPQLKGKFHAVRVLRNFKDSLISRVLYCKNVRYAQGLPNHPEEDALIEKCKRMDTASFINHFLVSCPLIPDWIEEITVFERGTFAHTFYYEMLLHNARDEFLAWMSKHLRPAERNVALLDRALEMHSFRKMFARTTPGFIGSTGVGQWMALLHDNVSRHLDAQYLALRSKAIQFPDTRKPTAGI